MTPNDPRLAPERAPERAPDIRAGAAREDRPARPAQGAVSPLAGALSAHRRMSWRKTMQGEIEDEVARIRRRDVEGRALLEEIVAAAWRLGAGANVDAELLWRDALWRALGPDAPAP